MASKKIPPAATQIAHEVLARLEAQAPPEGTAAALHLSTIDFGKLIPKLVGGLIEVAGIARDGHVSPADAVRIAEQVVGLIVQLRRESAPDA